MRCELLRIFKCWFLFSTILHGDRTSCLLHSLLTCSLSHLNFPLGNASPKSPAAAFLSDCEGLGWGCGFKPGDLSKASQGSRQALHYSIWENCGNPSEGRSSGVLGTRENWQAPAGCRCAAHLLKAVSTWKSTSSASRTHFERSQKLGF